jgi:hypothetical protein
VPAYHLPIDRNEERPAFHDYSWGYIKTEDNPYSGQAEAKHSPRLLTVKGKYIGKVAYSWCDLYFSALSRLGDRGEKWTDLFQHMSDNSSRNSLGHNGRIRELSETLMFPRGSEHINDVNFSAFKGWLGYNIRRSYTGPRRWGLAGKHWIREFEAKVFPCSLCMLDNGMLGKANPWCEVGDELFLLRGADCPFLLRRDGENYRFVGPAYFYRLYRAQPWRFDGDDVRDITLV